MVKFSIIIPVYNAEKTIERCLDSILKITYQDFEVVLIDDGSSDRSLEICRKYSQEYDYIKTYSIKNAGAGQARNKGVELSTGQYILFCDADDWYCSEELDKILQLRLQNKNKGVLFCFDFNKVWEDGYSEKYGIADGIIELDSSIKYSILSSKRLSREVGLIVWNKIFERAIISSYGIEFPQRDKLKNRDDWAEDMIFVMEYVAVAQSVSMHRFQVYNNYIPVHHTKELIKYSNKNRIEHMVRMLKYFDEFCVRTECIQLSDEQRTIIFLVRIRNYIYQQLSDISVLELRRQLLGADCFAFLKINIKTARKSKKSIIAQKIPEMNEDYLRILTFLLDGNKMAFRVSNKLHMIHINIKKCFSRELHER